MFYYAYHCGYKFSISFSHLIYAAVVVVAEKELQ